MGDGGIRNGKRTGACIIVSQMALHCLYWWMKGRKKRTTTTIYAFISIMYNIVHKCAPILFSTPQNYVVTENWEYLAG